MGGIGIGTVGAVAAQQHHDVVAAGRERQDDRRRDFRLIRGLCAIRADGCQLPPNVSSKQSLGQRDWGQASGPLRAVSGVDGTVVWRRRRRRGAAGIASALGTYRC